MAKFTLTFYTDEDEGGDRGDRIAKIAFQQGIDADGLHDFVRSHVDSGWVTLQFDTEANTCTLVPPTQQGVDDDAAARAWADETAAKVGANFSVARAKLESRLTEGPNEYYEAHWKLDFSHSPEYWEGELRKFLRGRPELLRSRSLLDTRVHYLTQRIYVSEDHLAASAEFNRSGVGINFGGMPLKRAHYERCLWDSNATWDAGWASN
jgi:hypothetical protein